ncbi:hypothetical protein GCM10008949_41120 [Deinococcus humi]|nr:hypothetical protein GCM10008949_41120 [Deinococcus humi]
MQTLTKFCQSLERDLQSKWRMTFLMIALLPAAIALCLLVALAVSVVIRTVKGERWHVPTEEMGPVVPSSNLQVNLWINDGLTGGIVRESVA